MGCEPPSWDSWSAGVTGLASWQIKWVQMYVLSYHLLEEKGFPPRSQYPNAFYSTCEGCTLPNLRD